MAKKIALGLELHGKDAEEFMDHLDDPYYPPQGKEMLNRAYVMYKARGRK